MSTDENTGTGRQGGRGSGQQRETPREALARLMEGNRRFLAGVPRHPDQGAERRVLVAARPEPLAVVLTCADPRLLPGAIFDCGIGDLFVVRVGGNVIDDTVLGSIEFGVTVQDAPLVLVLGHTRCGAVEATIDALQRNTPLPGALGALAGAIEPAVRQAQAQPGDLLTNAITNNVIHGVRRLCEPSRLYASRLTAGTVAVVGAVYDVETGAVSFMVGD